MCLSLNSSNESEENRGDSIPQIKRLLVTERPHNDFLEALTESEKILSKKFMRVVTGGKGSKPVPILFPTNLQNFISIMLNVRGRCVPESNEYLLPRFEKINK